MYVHVCVYLSICSDHCAEALFEEEADDQSLPLVILEALLKVRMIIELALMK